MVNMTRRSRNHALIPRPSTDKTMLLFEAEISDPPTADEVATSLPHSAGGPKK